MDEQEKLLEKLRKIAIKDPDKIKIIETSVDPDTQIEFYEKIHNIGNKNKSYDLPELKEKLTKETDTEKLKEILATLTSINEVEAFRILESYIEKAPQELKKWAFLSYQQSKLFLESSLLDEEAKIYVSSGLGGLGHKLRYFFAFASNTKLSENQINSCKAEIEYYFRKNDSVLEEFNAFENFIACTALIPIYINVMELLQDIVEEINQYGNFLQQNVFITNEKNYNAEELKYIFENDNQSN